MDERIMIAAGAASLSVGLFPGSTPMQALDASCWACIGGVIVHPDGQPVEDLERCNEALGPVLEQLADFVRLYPDAGVEPLYRYAGGREIHQRPADGFDDVYPAFRIAYEVFRSTLLTADRVFLEEEKRAAAKARAEAVQAPVLVPEEDTILAQHGGILERIGDRPAMVNLGGPVVAASEGEGGDGSAEMGAAAGSAAVDHGSPAAVEGDSTSREPVAPPATGSDGGAADPASLGEAVSDGSASAADAAAAQPVSGDAGPAGAAVDAAGEAAPAAAVAAADDPSSQRDDAAPDGPNGQPDTPGAPPEAPVKPRRK